MTHVTVDAEYRCRFSAACPRTRAVRSGKGDLLNRGMRERVQADVRGGEGNGTGSTLESGGKWV